KERVGGKVDRVSRLVKQGDLDAALVEVQMIERAIPTLQLLQVDAHAPLLLPTRNVAAAVAVTNVIAFQPAGQCVFTGWPRQPIGQQSQHAAWPVVDRIFLGQQLRPAATGIENLPQPELVEQMT